MSDLKMKDYDGADVFLKMGGSGTELDPFVPIQDVRIQDQTTPQFSIYLGEALDMSASFRSTQVEDIETLNITTTILPAVGNFLCCKENAFFSQIEITSVTPVAGDDYDVGVSMPLDHQYTTSAFVCVQNCDMNVDGSSTPVEFFVTPFGATAGTEWDITRLLVSMTHDVAGDDGLFGGIPALAVGTYFRIEDGTNFNLFNAKENSEFAIEGYDITYPNRSGKEGVYGTRSRTTFNGPDKRGVVFRLAADTSDKFLACVRDDLSLSTGLVSFRAKVQGQVVEP
jgi:hypothetical protein